MSLQRLSYLLEKEELTSSELAYVISTYLQDTGETARRITQVGVVSKYNTIKKMMAKFVDAKCYYLSSGLVTIRNVIENKNPRDFRDNNIYFNQYGDVFMYYRGLFHPIKTENNHISHKQPQRFSDFL